jgi:hypothetical protein
VGLRLSTIHFLVFGLSMKISNIFGDLLNSS